MISIQPPTNLHSTQAPSNATEYNIAGEENWSKKKAISKYILCIHCRTNIKIEECIEHMFDCSHPKLETRATNILLSDTGTRGRRQMEISGFMSVPRLGACPPLPPAVTHVSIKLRPGLPPSCAVCRAAAWQILNTQLLLDGMIWRMKKKERCFKT